MNPVNRPRTAYVGRFAPSPTGPLHAGSLVAATASFLDARAHHGQWLIRLEDVDEPRTEPGPTDSMLATLHAYGFITSQPVMHQSRRTARYEAALNQLRKSNRAYRCRCSRKQIVATRQTLGLPETPPGSHTPYPGTCRNAGVSATEAHSWRLNTDGCSIHWTDRWSRQENSESVGETVGDFILRRRDLLWSYQLAVVVDDAAQQVTDVVRGDDLADNTARQCCLQAALGAPRPRYLHVPVLRDLAGNKLSKQTQAPALPKPASEQQAVAVLNQALSHLELGQISAGSITGFWSEATARWAAQFKIIHTES